MKQRFDDDEQKKEIFFMQTIKEEELQEMEVLQLAHQTQLERTKASADEAIQSLLQQHQQIEQGLQENHQQTLQGIQNSYLKDVFNTILNQQETYTKLIERHHNEQVDFLVKMQEEEDSLYTIEITEIEELCKEQGKPELEKKDLISVIYSIQEQVKKQHSDQMKELIVVQKEAMITLSQEQKEKRQEVKQNAPEGLLYDYSKKLKEKVKRKEALDDLEEGPSPPAFVPSPPPASLPTTTVPPRMASVPNITRSSKSVKSPDYEKSSRKPRSSHREAASNREKRKKPTEMTDKILEEGNNLESEEAITIIFTNNDKENDTL